MKLLVLGKGRYGSPPNGGQIVPAMASIDRDSCGEATSVENDRTSAQQSLLSSLSTVLDTVSARGCCRSVTSRSATPLGDPRGVPKRRRQRHHRVFFTRYIKDKKVDLILQAVFGRLEGFGANRQQQRTNNFQSVAGPLRQRHDSRFIRLIKRDFPAESNSVIKLCVTVMTDERLSDMMTTAEESTENGMDISWDAGLFLDTAGPGFETEENVLLQSDINMVNWVLDDRQGIDEAVIDEEGATNILHMLTANSEMEKLKFNPPTMEVCPSYSLADNSRTKENVPDPRVPASLRESFESATDSGYFSPSPGQMIDVDSLAGSPVQVLEPAAVEHERRTPIDNDCESSYLASGKNSQDWYLKLRADNNKASRLYRARKKEKALALEAEYHAESEKNQRLVRVLKEKESELDQLKNKLLARYLGQGQSSSSARELSSLTLNILRFGRK